MEEARTATGQPEPQLVGRYLMFGEIASGGMASVHYGLLSGAVGFRRPVAIKKLHQQFASDPEFVEQFVDEARLAARIRHPNVVQTLDVVAENRTLLLVMDYVDGLTLSRLLQLAEARNTKLPVDVVVSILVGALHGLHAAHEARDELGTPLSLVHRDFSPQNILVGQDGVARVLDFGVAKAAARVHSTQGAKIKGKLRYMAPEQVQGNALDRRTDLFAAGVVLWQALTGKYLFDANAGPASIVQQVVSATIQPPSRLDKRISPALDQVVLRALSRSRDARYQTAEEMALALEDACRAASSHQVAHVQRSLGEAELQIRAETLASIERTSREVLDARASVSEIISSPRASSSPDLLSEFTEPVAQAADERTAQVSPAALRQPEGLESSQVTGVSSWTSATYKRPLARWVPLIVAGGCAAAFASWLAVRQPPESPAAETPTPGAILRRGSEQAVSPVAQPVPSSGSTETDPTPPP